MVRTSIAGLLFSIVFLVAASGDDGLVFEQTFDKPGEVVRDASPNANPVTIRGAAFISRGEGHALHFDGVDDYAECPSSPALDLTDAVTLEAWVRPDRATEPPCEAGIVGKGVACFGAYGLTYFRDRAHIYVSSTINNCIAALPLGAWSHVVGTFDGTQLSIYLDGKPAETKTSIASRINTTPEPLFLGRNDYRGLNFFPGDIDEVRIYKRALGADEILARYLATAEGFGRDVSGMKRMSVKVRVYPLSGRVIVDVDPGGLRPLEEGAILETSLREPAGGAASMEQKVAVPPTGVVEVSFDVSALAPGQYVAQARLAGAGEEERSAEFTLPGPPGGGGEEARPKLLNNLVMELLHAEGIADGTFPFTVPREGWVFFRIEAEPGARVTLSAGLASGMPLFSDDVTPSAAVEAMRFLPAGPDALRLRAGNGRVRSVTIRAIPQIHWCKLYPAPYLPRVPAYGPYDWDYLERAGVLENVNVMISRMDVPLDAPEHTALLSDWIADGKKWIVEVGLTHSLDGEEVAKSWLNEAGMSRPGLSGVLIDEFGGAPLANYRAWADGM
ncbi:MAG: LamG domain-containing protein, partial [Planctomycetota bacterium]